MSEISEKMIDAGARVHDHWAGEGTIGAYNARRNTREILTAALARAEANAGGPEQCQTCYGTGSEGRHSICRDCDGEGTVPAEQCVTHPATQPSGLVEVKPLKWADRGNGVSYAESACGVYKVGPDGSWWRDDGSVEGTGGKVGAQSGYERRILSALTAGKPEQAVPSGWQPKETIPTEVGTRVRVLVETEIEMQEDIPALLIGGWKRTSDADKIIGWLPAAPTAGGCDA